MAEELEKKMTLKLPKFNLWALTTVICLVVALVALTGWPIELRRTGMTTTGMAVALTGDQAAKKAVDYINNNVIQTGTATLVKVEEISELYKVTVSYQGQEIPVYITKDGLYLFLSQPLDTSQELPKQPEQPEQPQEIPKKDKPTAELFVMSFCPFGVQAEKTMKPVVDLLGEKADIKIRFIVNIQGDDVDSIRSLHGTTEAQEDIRQACIMKYYDQETLWEYLMSIGNDCYGKIDTRDAEALDTCWKDAATKAGIDIEKIDTCSKGSDGLDLLKEDERLAQQYGVTGSPTLIINGVRYSGSRTSEAYKQAICDGFTTEPSECSQTLSEAQSSNPSGAC